MAKRSSLTIVRIPESQLHVNDDYQRNLNVALVDKIVEGFDEALVDPVRVWKTGEDSYEIIDGQHTTEALRQLGRRVIPCFVLNGSTTMEDAAAFFVKRNTGRKPLRPLEIFKADLAAKNPRAVAINKIVEEFGLRIASGVADGIAAIRKVQRVYDDAGPTGLRNVLTVITGAWDSSDKDRLHGNMILGISGFIQHDNPDLEKLIERLKRVAPVTLLRQAHAVAGTNDGGGSNIMAAAVENEIRKTIRKRRL